VKNTQTSFSENKGSQYLWGALIQDGTLANRIEVAELDDSKSYKKRKHAPNLLACLPKYQGASG
jgi:hypothetical protein